MLRSNLLTTTAVGTFVVEKPKLLALAIAVTTSLILMALAYYITPQDKEK
jgi:hypothetical protein